jgi:uncharacterized protein YgbK (DUF1537 family)
MSLPQAWRILADDLTGALDSAAAFTGKHEVPVFLQAPDSPAPIQAWATGSRDVPGTTLPGVLQACLPWFTAPGTQVFKKVDSLLRGNSFAEVAWLLRHGGFDGVVFAPAYPAQGRLTQGGQHRVGSEAIDLRAAFAAVGLTVRSGSVPDAQGGVLVPDVLTDADLDRLASHPAPRWLWCGSAGLAWALARQGQHAPTHSTSPTPGLTHTITASRHPVVRGQIGTIDLYDLSHPQPLPTAEAQALLHQRALALVRALPRPDNLVVVGGDTLLALCQAAGVHSLLACASPRSGWGRATLQGGPWHGVACYSRSGAFGAPDDLSALLAMLTAKEPSL